MVIRALGAVLVLALVLATGCGRGIGTQPETPPPGPTSGGGNAQLGATLNAAPTTITPGTASTLTWTSTGATSASIAPGVGGVAASGSATVSPAQTTTYTITVQGSGGTTATATAMVTVTQAPPPGGGVSGSGIATIQHIVWLLQENRSFDHYFGLLGTYREMRGLPNDVNGLPLNVAPTDRKGNHIHPFHIKTMCIDGLTPAWGATIVDVNNGKMDNFMHTANPSVIDPDGTRAMGYYDWTDIPYYYELATQYATSDNMFSPIPARTPPNRYAEIAASSYGNINSGPIPSSALTIFDLLDKAGISWKFYLLSPKVNDLHAFSISKRDAANVRPGAEYFTDLANNTLPAVVFLDHDPGLDEHPTTNIQHGAAFAKTLIDAFMASSAYPNSVFFLSYDEGGGLYDHVPLLTVPAPDNIPPKLLPTDKQGDFTRTGFRVPFIAISPWVKAHYVSHVPRDLTAILKFIEVRYGLPNLTKRDAWVDDLTEMFDFSAPQVPTPPPLPEQPQNGKCNLALEVSPEHK